MKNTNKNYERGIVPIIIIIAVLVALGGVGAVLMYIMNNEAELTPLVEEAREERAQQAQEGGYPSLWVEAGLPEYPGGTLTKTRQGNNLLDGVNVTLETNDSPQIVKEYFDGEMATRGFTVQDRPGNEFVAMAAYLSGDKQLSMQAIENGDTGIVKIQLSYHE